MQTVPVYEFLNADGTVTGCGTAREMQFWKAEGVFAEGDKLGAILCQEPASEDERREAAWAKQLAKQYRVAFIAANGYDPIIEWSAGRFSIATRYGKHESYTYADVKLLVGGLARLKSKAA